ncbi:MAG: DNRLRE domain-containing protein, partial [Crocinitomicaceae bacterium]|nr:DNRLRE domain-containing protein [Crocinitomicaceae bacterium]
MKINFVFLFLGVVLCNSISYSQIISTTKHFSTDGMDALVISGANAGNNFGTASNFGIEQPVTRRAYLYMDFSDIPTDAIVLSATLNLHSYSVVNHPTLKGYITQLKGTANWNESITWNTQPAYTEFLSGSEQMINSELSTVGLQEYDITTDVQNMVNHPTLNKGWVLRLQHESGANRRTYWYSREHSNAAERPTITLEYILPIEISGTVNHANEGLTDGEITPTVIQGSGTYTDYTWYKLTGGPATIVETGFNISNAAVSNLSDGLYLLKVKDDLDNIGYNYFLVGEYGATTTVDFRWYGSLSNSSAFNEDATVKYDVVDNDGNSVGGNNSSYLLYQNASQYNSTLLKYKVTIDPEFVIENATLNLFGYGHYSNNSDPNDAYASIITQQWYENIVTWNTRPSITVTDQ